VTCAGGTITTPLTAYNAAAAVQPIAGGNSYAPANPAFPAGQTLPLTVSSSNAGPRDSNISNAGTINGNFYLGSGTHVLDNTGTINGNVNVDQSPSIASFATGVPVGQTVTAGFAGGGSTFVASDPNPSREMADFGSGINLATSHVLLSLTYNGVARSSYLEQAGLFKAPLRF
jgi:hypothetical protein